MMTTTSSDRARAKARAATPAAAVAAATRTAARCRRRPARRPADRHRRAERPERTDRPARSAARTGSRSAATAGPDLVSHEPVRGVGLPRPARRGLRLPARQRLPAQPRRRLRAGAPHPPVRAAQGATTSPASAVPPAATRRTRRCWRSTRERRRPRHGCATARKFEDLTALFPDEQLRLEYSVAQHDRRASSTWCRPSARASAASSCRRRRPARPRS